MKAVVIYNSQTGFTKRYAEWIAEELACEAVPYDKRNTLAIGDFDTVIFGSWYHAAMMPGSKWIKKQMAAHPAIRFIVFGTGASPMPSESGSETEIEEAFRHTFPTETYPHLPHFYMRGGFSMEKLGTADRLLMKMFFSQAEKAAATDPAKAEMNAVMK
ncbi:MAG: flavodoxin domain-containing protein, partial [Raoultibacter sp.]